MEFNFDTRFKFVLCLSLNKQVVFNDKPNIKNKILKIKY